MADSSEELLQVLRELLKEQRETRKLLERLVKESEKHFANWTSTR